MRVYCILILFCFKLWYNKNEYASSEVTSWKQILKIAQENQMQPITVIAEKLHLTPDEVEPYGKYKAKIDKTDIHNPENFGKLILVTSMNPTPAEKESLQ